MIVALLASLVAAAAVAGAPARAASPSEDGVAAATYVDDGQCAGCHREVAESYRELGMARSFARPQRARGIENTGDASRFTHAPSGIAYEMSWRGDELWFRQHAVDEAGGPTRPFEQRVDWILGSGNRARTYLFRTPGGELYQLPIAWYTQEGRWGMAPGYDRSDHAGVERQVRRECLFCHDAYPLEPVGDAYGDPAVFPEHLPEGIGCQRCHGPGSAHVAAARSGAREVARDAIVNPARLPRDRRDAVCDACHLQPLVALSSVRRFGRTDFSWRAGERLEDFRVELDAEEEGSSRADRFEINHHPYRLRQSRCYEASGGELGCLTCHDPHRKVPAAESAAHYRRACLSCHGDSDSRPGAAAMQHAVPIDVATADCAGCHMSKRRTRDVVHAVMTDHRIVRRAGGQELLAPLAERDPVLTGVVFLGEHPEGAEGEVYRAVAALRAGEGASAVEHLERNLAEANLLSAEPWIELAVGQMRQRRFAAAAATLRGVLERWPDDAAARERLPIALSGLARPEEALAVAEEALARRPDRVENWFNVGMLRQAAGRLGEAREALERALALRPNMASGWLRLGRLQRRLGDEAAARKSFERALAIAPGLAEAAAELSQLGAAARSP